MKIYKTWFRKASYEEIVEYFRNKFIDMEYDYDTLSPFYTFATWKLIELTVLDKQVKFVKGGANVRIYGIAKLPAVGAFFFVKFSHTMFVHDELLEYIGDDTDELTKWLLADIGHMFVSLLARKLKWLKKYYRRAGKETVQRFLPSGCVEPITISKYKKRKDGSTLLGFFSVILDYNEEKLKKEA